MEQERASDREKKRDSVRAREMEGDLCEERDRQAQGGRGGGRGGGWGGEINIYQMHFV